jgi:Zn-dependent protease/CBS domain-containing protein
MRIFSSRVHAWFLSSVRDPARAIGDGWRVAMAQASHPASAVGNTLTLFFIRGIPVRVHVSWLVIYGLIAWTLAVGYFPLVLPDIAARTAWLSALLAALLLFVSVFLHELSHSLVALRLGIPISGITLHIFGGVSQMEREPDEPGAELAIAAAGPITSFLIAGVVAALIALGNPGPTTHAVLQYLVTVNVVVGLFNLVPGFPLDGGRVLRAGLWKWSGNLQRATRIASQAGSLFGLVLILLGVMRGFTGEFLGGLWLVVIGVFLRQAATASYQQLVLRGALEPRTVREVMRREVVQVAPSVSLETLVDDYFWRYYVASFPVTDGERVAGIVAIQQLNRVPREQWPMTRVEQVMTPMSERLRVSPGESLWSAMQKLSGNGVGRAAVIDRDRLVGYLSMRDIMHVFTITTAGTGAGSSELPRAA